MRNLLHFTPRQIAVSIAAMVGTAGLVVASVLPRPGFMPKPFGKPGSGLDPSEPDRMVTGAEAGRWLREHLAETTGAEVELVRGETRWIRAAVAEETTSHQWWVRTLDGAEHPIPGAIDPTVGVGPFAEPVRYHLVLRSLDGSGEWREQAMSVVVSGERAAMDW